MGVAPFAEFVPDNAVYDAQVTGYGRNVLPVKTGWEPLNGTVPGDLEPLPGPCRGAIDIDYEGVRRVFAATADDIYEYDFAAVTAPYWVSVNGSLTIALADGAMVRFDRRGDWLRACDGANKLMRFDLTDATSPVFVETTDSPVGLLLVASFFDLTVGIYNDGDQGFFAWSDTDDDTNWSTGNAGEQPIPGGGVVTGMAVGEMVLVFQRAKMHRFQYTGGVSLLLSRVEIDNGRGALGPDAVAVAGNTVFFVSVDGFYRCTWAGQVAPIGADRVNEFWLARCSDVDRPFTLVFEDPLTERVFFLYLTSEPSGVNYDEALPYDYSLDKWGPPGDWAVQYVFPTRTSGVTLEQIGAEYGSLEDYNLPLDIRANFPSEGLIGVFDGTNTYGTREGLPLAAEVETAPSLGPDARRMRASSIFLDCDAENWTAAIGAQERLNAPFVYSAESPPETVTGEAGVHVSGRAFKVRGRIPAGEAWTRLTKANVRIRAEGRR